MLRKVGQIATVRKPQPVSPNRQERLMKNADMIYKATADAAVSKFSRSCGGLGEVPEALDLKQFVTELCDAFEAIETREAAK